MRIFTTEHPEFTEKHRGFSEFVGFLKFYSVDSAISVVNSLYP
jgi:hypothetical protein